MRLFDPAPVRFACSCSAQRSAGALQSLGEAEVKRILAEQQAITIDCQFCNRQYRFGPEEVEALFGDQTHTLH